MRGIFKDLNPVHCGKGDVHQWVGGKGKLESKMLKLKPLQNQDYIKESEN